MREALAAMRYRRSEIEHRVPRKPRAASGRRSRPHRYRLSRPASRRIPAGRRCGRRARRCSRPQPRGSCTKKHAAPPKRAAPRDPHSPWARADGWRLGHPGKRIVAFMDSRRTHRGRRVSALRATTRLTCSMARRVVAARTVARRHAERAIRRPTSAIARASTATASPCTTATAAARFHTRTGAFAYTATGAADGRPHRRADAGPHRAREGESRRRRRAKARKCWSWKR